VKAQRNLNVYFPWLVALVDLVLIIASAAAAARFRQALPYWSSSGSDVLDHAVPLSAFFIITWLALLGVWGTYDRHNLGAGQNEFRLVVNASLVSAGLVGVGAYLVKSALSRGFFILLFTIGIVLLLMGRLVMRRLLQQARRRGRLTQKVLAVGTPGYIGEIIKVLRRENWLGYDVIGCLVPPDYAGIVETSDGTRVLGTTDDLRQLVDEHHPDIVFFTAGAVASSQDLRRMAWTLEDKQHVHIVVAPNVTDVSAERVRVRPVAGLPLMHLGRPRSTAASSDAKRLFDLVFASIALVFAAPILIAVALWIKLDDRGPVFFRQTRVGRDGEEFPCFKLRSMVVNAEELLATMEAREGHVLFKDANDPRITRPGRLIRRLSIDELPQLFNVLRGEMSLVGPRPPLRSEVDQYGDDMLRRLNVRPGITGLWQVSGRSDLSWEDTVRLDLYYVDNWSMIQDLLILARTAGAVLGSRGAY
jgi:exopolysaccharide biosynthesis polyprenyl glycosylphosphotransferase